MGPTPIRNTIFNKMIICPKCKQPIVVPEGKDFILCCNDVIYIIHEAHNSKNESGFDDTRR